MPLFVRNIAQFIHDQYPDKSQVTVVLPSQRAGKYIQEELFSIVQKPFFSPRFITINTWIQQLVSETVLSQTELLFQLYEVHLSLADKKESFDEFMRWGKTLLSDCDEIDRYLINPTDLFKNLRDVKDIENWSFDSTKELTENQKRFMEFWDKLGDYYQTLQLRLTKSGKTYNGAAYRKVAENIDLCFRENKEAHFLFVGFNALSPAEISIMKQLQQTGRGHILLEADRFFLDDRQHEAGTFIRELKQQVPGAQIYTSNLLLKEEKNIEVIACAQPTSQVKAAMTVLESFPEEKIKKTLLLLADESLIVPAIKHIPLKAKEANITLGLPLKNTLLRTWVDLLFEAQENIHYFKTTAVYHKTIVRFFRHPFVHKLASEKDVREIEAIQLRIIKKNRLFSKPDFPELSEKLNELIRLVFASWEDNWGSALQRMHTINALVFPCFDIQQDLLERSAINQFDTVVREMVPVFHSQSPTIGLFTFKQLFNPGWMNKAVAYYGNPTEGLQIMGLLETRMLDFETLIVIGMNEGKMPPGNHIQTIIPMDLRRYFGLPTPTQKDALFAHHFYRLLPSAKDIYITYNNAPGEGIATNEPSRYLRQLELELARENKNINWSEKTFLLEKEESHPVQIERTKEITDAILNFFSSGVSASALKKFITCPLDFYYRYILGLYENEEVEEEMESSTFGDIVHRTLEALYTPFAEKKIQVTTYDIEKMLKVYPVELQKQVSEVFNAEKETFEKGRNLLSFEMASYQIDRFLRTEKKMLEENPDKELYIESLENKIEVEFEIEWDNKKYPLKLLGLIDRIDNWGNRRRIVDYKTGNCKEEDVKFNFSSYSSVPDYPKLKKELTKHKFTLQLGIYNVLYYYAENSIPDATGVISLTALSKGFQSLHFPKRSEITEVNPEFIDFMQQILLNIGKEMLRLEVFEHSPEAKYCEYCYK